MCEWKLKKVQLSKFLSLFFYFHRPAADCDVNCHKKCEKLAANLCGVNQKLIVEALASVRRENLGAEIRPGILKNVNMEFDCCSRRELLIGSAN